MYKIRYINYNACKNCKKRRVILSSDVILMHVSFKVLKVLVVALWSRKNINVVNWCLKWPDKHANTFTPLKRSIYYSTSAAINLNNNFLHTDTWSGCGGGGSGSARILGINVDRLPWRQLLWKIYDYAYSFKMKIQLSTQGRNILIDTFFF